MSIKSTTLTATDPHASATVLASAGTGKTYLLVTRLLRLLLEGAAPDSILAITFTRKAAAEMHTRLTQRLHELACMEPAQLTKALITMGMEPTPRLLNNAMSLYERQLRDHRRVRATTFHAFCQDLLRRFPLEAEVPAGFDLVDSEALLRRESWEALLSNATAHPDGEVGRALEYLFDHCASHHSARDALTQFLHQRSDWWAYTYGLEQPNDGASAALAKQLQITPGTDPWSSLYTDTLHERTQEYVQLLVKHATKLHLERAEKLSVVLDEHALPVQRSYAFSSAFLTKESTPRALKASKPLEKALGTAGLARLLTLHSELCTAAQTLQDIYYRHRTHQLSHAWYISGSALLEHYQRIKIERRVLDFGDLEWKAYLLLNHADNAHWVQYKLDQRLDHLLIDEFQDTNPTQWRLLLPLLRELAAGETERTRSVFMVGDGKQSIYRFRRADAALLGTAQSWLSEHLHASTHTLSTSWRSAPAIIDFVNLVFSEGQLRTRLAHFETHSTHRDELWGRVEVLPLIRANEDNANAPTTGLRDPLLMPRFVAEDTRYHQEGRMIAGRITALMTQPVMVGAGAAARPLGYDDIMILVRHRSHVHAYEAALRAAGIPYLGADRGTLLECLEISDMVALLNTLITPYNDLALATVLRSPLFDAGDEDLMHLAQQNGGPWMDRLLALGPNCTAGSPLARAARWLPHWHSLASQLPAHDLLDRIFSEGDVPARFEAAFPTVLRTRVRANLTRFIELALEVDSGRYPSLSHFLHRLEDIRISDDDAPDEAPRHAPEGSVRILTIHASKGLEAPMVFLADSAAARPAARAYQALVRWPTDSARPTHFLLPGKSAELDSITQTVLGQQQTDEEREQANLLYVALTRAKQMLFVTGCEPGRGDDLGWYGLITARLGVDNAALTQTWHHESGAMPLAGATAPKPDETAMPPIDARLARPLCVTIDELEIAPSRATQSSLLAKRDDEDRHTADVVDRQRGLAIHRLIELLSADTAPDPLRARRVVANELELTEEDPALETWTREALGIVTHAQFATLFDARRYRQAYNEVPIQYLHENRLVHGIIDRLVVTDDECIVVDYKTHRSADAATLDSLAASYREQLRWYCEGVQRLWPDRRVRSLLLFTACAASVVMDED